MDLPFGGSHAPDCTYRMGHAAPCNCWRSDPDQNPELAFETENRTGQCACGSPATVMNADGIFCARCAQVDADDGCPVGSLDPDNV